MQIYRKLISETAGPIWPDFHWRGADIDPQIIAYFFINN